MKTTKKSTSTIIILAIVMVSSLFGGCAASHTSGSGETEFALLHWKSTKATQTTVGVGKPAKQVPSCNDEFTKTHATRATKESKESYRERLISGKVSIMESIQRAKARKENK